MHMFDGFYGTNRLGVDIYDWNLEGEAFVHSDIGIGSFIRRGRVDVGTGNGERSFVMFIGETGSLRLITFTFKPRAAKNLSR